ncbi:hypothetical protein CFC21_099071 [Triticum aestivum]|uniref:Uncharacterized protein n=2 Tax=Triticum aestivum TaxID=4565 RepID=A0A3B6RNA5_WHEAT|nr:hypothetical protein CFC21_099071 [Triticum aestivum]
MEWATQKGWTQSMMQILCSVVGKTEVADHMFWSLEEHSYDVQTGLEFPSAVHLADSAGAGDLVDPNVTIAAISPQPYAATEPELMEPVMVITDPPASDTTGIY